MVRAFQFRFANAHLMRVHMPDLSFSRSLSPALFLTPCLGKIRISRRPSSKKPIRRNAFHVNNFHTFSCHSSRRLRRQVKNSGNRKSLSTDYNCNCTYELCCLRLIDTTGDNRCVMQFNRWYILLMCLA